jgi:hypothetical protein
MRYGLTLTGLGLTVCGAAALGLGLGAFDPALAARGVLDPAVSRFADRSSWFWPAVAGAGVSVALVGLLWLLARGRAAVLRRVTLTRRAARARVRAAGAGLVEDLRAVPGVRDARFRLSGSAAWSRLLISVTCDEDADLALVRGHLGQDCLMRVRAELEMYEVPAVVRFRLICGEAAAR